MTFVPLKIEGSILDLQPFNWKDGEEQKERWEFRKRCEGSSNTYMLELMDNILCRSQGLLQGCRFEPSAGGKNCCISFIPG